MDKFGRGKFAISALLVLSGFVVGLLASVYLFAIDVDLLAVPYINKGVKLTQDLTVMQNDIELHIPQGTQLLLSKRMPSSNEYSILINSFWDKENITEPIGSRPKYFEAKESAK